MGAETREPQGAQVHREASGPVSGTAHGGVKEAVMV